MENKKSAPAIRFIKERMHKLHTFLCKELEIAELEKNITQEVCSQI